MDTDDKGDLCPLLSDVCVKRKCRWYIKLQGTHPQSGKPIDHWGCAVEWIPLMLVETSKEVRQGAAATESFRNEMVKVGSGLLGLAQTNSVMRLNDGRKRRS